MFAIVARDEVWTLGAEPRLRERRLSHGQATLSGRDITADDSLDASLLAVCDAETALAVASLPQTSEVMIARIVVTVRRASDHVMKETTIALTSRSRSLVTAPATIASDSRFLLDATAAVPELHLDYRGVPLVWENGSGSVLLHEAAGHPAEHGLERIGWPSWLSVRDEPSFERDDTGELVRPVDLLAGERPSAIRRESFASVPLPRLSNVIARADGTSFERPERRIEITLVDGGRYDPLTDDVTLFVSAADLVEGARRRHLHPFVIHEQREAVARALQGAEGPVLRYPGVICSSEGQEIAVGSHAPALLTRFE
jgi:hypothetical protein